MSRVWRLCPVFRTQPGAYPPETQNRTLRHRAGEQKIRPKPSASGSVERGNAATVENTETGKIGGFWTLRRKRKQEKGIGAFRANAYSQQPAVRAAARVCGFWKLTLFSRFPERFDAKFEKSHRKAPCHNGLRRRFDRKSVRFMPLQSAEVSVAAQILLRHKQR